MKYSKESSFGISTLVIIFTDTYFVVDFVSQGEA
jgi:hypothetical protein